MAVQGGKDEVLQNLWVWDKMIQNPDKLNNKFYLAKHKEEMTAFYHALFSG
jgi:hypothetical protein